MNVLGLDTTGTACACALVTQSTILGHKSEAIGRGHAERLAPMVKEMLSESGRSISDINQIAVCTGPGSFTGLRVALAFAKGLALPRNIPIIGLSSLTVFAAQQDPMREKSFSAFTDVKRGEVCFQRFDKGAALSSPQTLKREGLDLSHAKELKGAISTPIMAWMSMGLSPQDYPAAPLYSRAPDAKLPGGITPK